MIGPLSAAIETSPAETTAGVERDHVDHERLRVDRVRNRLVLDPGTGCEHDPAAYRVAYRRQALRQIEFRERCQPGWLHGYIGSLMPMSVGGDQGVPPVRINGDAYKRHHAQQGN